MPLIGQLSNPEFVANVDYLLQGQSRSVVVRLRLGQTCACGCGAAVAAPRKFINQEHYSAWLAQVRYFGRNRKSGSAYQCRKTGKPVGPSGAVLIVEVAVLGKVPDATRNLMLVLSAP